MSVNFEGESPLFLEFIMNLKGGRPKETYSRCVNVGEIYESRSYGKFEVIEYKSSRDVLIRFLDTGFETRVQSSAAKIGNVRDRLVPTHSGVGIFDNDKQDTDKNAYKVWTDMLRRCYVNQGRSRDTAYIDCSISDEFKYYSVFQDWYKSQIVGEGFQLDKDLISKGNKVYSKETCCFIPSEINQALLINQSKRGEYPIGVSKHTRDGVFRAALNIHGRRIHIGLYDTPEEAFYAYKERRESYLKSLAEKWKEKMDERAYNALLNYEVKITD